MGLFDDYFAGGLWDATTPDFDSYFTGGLWGALGEPDLGSAEGSVTYTDTETDKSYSTTFVQGFHVIPSGAEKEIELVNLSWSNRAFYRDKGLIQKKFVILGTEVYTTYADAFSLGLFFDNCLGNKCTVATGAGLTLTDIDCIEVQNSEPRFHLNGHYVNYAVMFSDVTG